MFMKILLTKNQIDVLEDITYDLIFSIKKGVRFINHLFIDNYIFIDAYSEVINYMITGFYSSEYNENNLLNKEKFKNLLYIHFALVNYENDYYKVRTNNYLSDYLYIFDTVKLVLIEQDYYLEISDDIVNDLLFYLKSYLGIIRKEKSKFIKFYRTFYSFDKNKENFKNYLDMYLRQLGTVKRKENYKEINKLYRNIKSEIELVEMSDEEKEEMEKSINEIKVYIENFMLRHYWDLGKDINDTKKNNISEIEHYKNKAQEYREWFGKGYNINFVKLLHKYYLCYPYIENINPNLSWGHYKLLLSIKDDTLRKYYQSLTIKNDWDVSQLKNELNSVNKVRKKLVN